jgi:hypothetical protein
MPAAAAYRRTGCAYRAGSWPPTVGEALAAACVAAGPEWPAAVGSPGRDAVQAAVASASAASVASAGPVLRGPVTDPR